jgi:hypothetical protein
MKKERRKKSEEQRAERNLIYTSWGTTEGGIILLKQSSDLPGSW